MSRLNSVLAGSCAEISRRRHRPLPKGIGNAKLGLDDSEGAELAYFEALGIRRELVNSVPDDARYLGDVGMSRSPNNLVNTSIGLPRHAPERSIKFPRGATALMRVCIQKLVPLLEDNGKELNQRVSSLVRKGLEMEMQQATEVLKFLRGDSAQLNSLESQADRETALRFLDSLKEVLERRMSHNRDET